SRHVLRHQRQESSGVIPVEEVTVKAIQPLHRREAELEAFDELQRAYVTEIAGRGSGEQQHSDISRRGSMGEHGFGIFLKIVRCKPVVFFSDESLKELPCASR